MGNNAVNRILNNTKVCRLQELVSFKRGRNITASEMVDGDIPVVSAGLDYSGYHNAWNVKGPSITISSSGANAGVVIFHNYNFWAADCLYAYQSKNMLFSYYFLKYLQPVMFNLQRGSAQPHVYSDNVNNLKVVLPSLDEQMNISKVLSNYDQLIENNNKRIKLLEETAQELYKEWFVRFRFPGYEKEEFVKSEIGNIPSNFKIEKIGNILSYYIGGGWGNDNYSDEYPISGYVIRGADFPRIQNGDTTSCPYRYHKESNIEKRILKENDIILEISGGTDEQPVGRSVFMTKGILDKLSNNAICASFCKLLRINEKVVNPIYFYYWLNYLYDTRIIDKFQLKSTGIINFKFEYFLRKGFCMLPSKEMMDNFSSRIKDIYSMIDNLASCNLNLTKQRDSLLPRLMSGKISLEGKEII